MRALLLCLALVACAGLTRTMSYGNKFADARFTVDGKSFSGWLHPQDNTVMLQQAVGAGLADGAPSALTFGLVNTAPRSEVWRSAALAFVTPAGCDAQNLRPIDQDVAWEFDVVCPAGVDFRALIAAQRESLRAGVPLR